MVFSRKTAVLTLVALIAVLSAFSLGKMVAADTSTGPAPGSTEDPLVSRSYVENRIKALEARVAELEKKLNGSAVVSPSGSTNTVTEQKVYAKRDRNWANVRTEPSTGAPLLTECYPGTAMILLGTQDDWFNVRMPDGRVGWVHNSVAEIR